MTDEIAAGFAAFDPPAHALDWHTEHALDVAFLGGADNRRMTLGDAARRAVTLVEEVSIGGRRAGRHGAFFGADGGNGLHAFFEAFSLNALSALAGPGFGNVLGEVTPGDFTMNGGDDIENPITEDVVILGKLLLSALGQKINEAGASYFPPLLFVVNHPISFENGKVRTDRHRNDPDLVG